MPARMASASLPPAARRAERRLGLRQILAQPVHVALGLCERLGHPVGAAGDAAGAGQQVAVAEPHLQPVDQDGLLARLDAQRVDLGAQRAFALGLVVAAAAAGAGGERGAEALDLRVSAGRQTELASSSASLCFLAPCISSAISRSRLNSSRLASDSRASTFGRRSRDGLLQHAAGVLVLLQVGPVLADVALQRRDAGIAPVDVDQVAGALELGLVELRLQLVHLDGVLGAQPVAVGLDLGLADRHRLLDADGGEPHRPRPECRRQQQSEQTCCQEAQGDQHRGLDRHQWRILGCTGARIPAT